MDIGLGKFFGNTWTGGKRALFAQEFRKLFFHIENLSLVPYSLPKFLAFREYNTNGRNLWAKFRALPGIFDFALPPALPA
jgi:hypothetical protein